MSFIIGYSIFVFAICFVFALISSMNTVYLSKKRYSKLHLNGPKVSVIIPARNEEDNIINLLSTLENQTYENYEVLVIDDSSTDNTWALINDFIKGKDQFRAFQSDPNVKRGRNGKTAAMKQLIPHTRGEIIIATDADTMHHKNSIAYGVSVLTEQKLDMFSGFPQVNIPSLFGELAVGSMNILTTMYTVLPFIKRKPTYLFTVANGQYLVMRKQALLDVGGFESIEDEILDDVQIARQFVKHNKVYQQHRASHLVTCNMYDNYTNSFRGISRIIAGIFPHKPWMFFPLIFFAIILISMSLAPIASILYLIFLGADLYFYLLTAGWLAFSISWFSISRLQRFSYAASLLWPITLILTIFMYLNSFFRKVFKRNIIWKGRDVNPEKKS